MSNVMDTLGMKVTDLLLLVLTAAALVLTWAITAYQWRLARRQNAIQLHAEYYGVEHYINVVAPMVQVRLKWRFLPNEKEREEYRILVAAGWAPALMGPTQNTGATRFALYVDKNRENADPVFEHYHHVASRAGMSEHQALAAMLHFWSRLAGLLNARAIDRQLAKQFFAPAYEHQRELFGELRRRVEVAIVPGDAKPGWLEHTLFLEQFFA